MSMLQDAFAASVMPVVHRPDHQEQQGRDAKSDDGHGEYRRTTHGSVGRVRRGGQ
jgi:hypothetical protein